VKGGIVNVSYSIIPAAPGALQPPLYPAEAKNTNSSQKKNSSSMKIAIKQEVQTSESSLNASQPVHKLLN